MELSSLYAALAMGLSLAMASQTARAADDGQLDGLLDAIAKVESRSDPAALGDMGRAAGVYQIHRSYWADATRILGVDWEYRDAWDPQKARQVVRAYLLHYGSGRSLLEIARIHNGGPKGHQKASTLAYAHKIERVLNGDAPEARPSY
jgi:hypothetical protein